MSTLAGFTAFLRGVAGIEQINLPSSSPAIPMAYVYAKEIVSLQIEQASCPLYDLAVYNLATDYLINWAPDPIAGGCCPGFFTKLRESYKITAFVPGVVSATADEGTSSSFVVPEAFKNFLLGDLQNLKTDFGRQYLAIAQRVGSLWGLT